MTYTVRNKPHAMNSRDYWQTNFKRLWLNGQPLSEDIYSYDITKGEVLVFNDDCNPHAGELLTENGISLVKFTGKVEVEFEFDSIEERDDFEAEMALEPWKRELNRALDNVDGAFAKVYSDLETIKKDGRRRDAREAHFVRKPEANSIRDTEWLERRMLNNRIAIIVVAIIAIVGVML